ncbi:LysE family transporter [Saccharopolyspora griseoalba]|uniref:LysE family transporter n=1 Tax=Saccharopolyspora griseoalba TaxID=1431848 RepID=A0ABW2LJL3_9PSEU
MPQFVPAEAPMASTAAALVLLFIAMTAVFLSLLVTLAVRTSTFLARPVVRRWLDRAAGTIFVGFGARLAVDH